MQMVPYNPMIWVGQHWLEIIGWIGVLTVLYKLYRVVDRALQPFRDLKTVKGDITAIKENHLSHMEVELGNVNNNITGLRGDMKELFSGLRDILSDVKDDIRLVMSRMP